MTVVCALRLGKNSGVIAADERETLVKGDTARTYDVARKIYVVGNSVVGYSGDVPYCTIIVTDAKKSLPEVPVLTDTLSSIESTYQSVRKEAFRKHVLERYGITETEYKESKFPPHLNPEFHP